MIFFIGSDPHHLESFQKKTTSLQKGGVPFFQGQPRLASIKNFLGHFFGHFVRGHFLKENKLFFLFFYQGYFTKVSFN